MQLFWSDQASWLVTNKFGTNTVNCFEKAKIKKSWCFTRRAAETKQMQEKKKKTLLWKQSTEKKKNKNWKTKIVQTALACWFESENKKIARIIRWLNFVFAIFRTHLLRLVSIDQISQKWHWRIHTSELSSRSYLQWRKKNIKFSRDCEVLPNLLAQFFGGLDKHLWAFWRRVCGCP